jgi:hypothetical protein
MVMTNLSSAVLFAATVGLAGCHDAGTVNPYPGTWLIDDFEAADGFPTDPSFERWGCRPLDGEHPIAASGCNRVVDLDLHPDAGSNGNHVLHLGAALYPMPTEGHDDTFTRAEVGTYVPDALPLDLRPYSLFSFWWKVGLDPEAANSLDPLTLYLRPELSCTTARVGDAAVPKNPFVLGKVTIQVKTDPVESAVNWQNSILKTADFTNSEYSSDQQGLSTWLPKCLSRVDGIKITLDSNKAVKPNHKVNFDLYVDDISLQP